MKAFVLIIDVPINTMTMCLQIVNNEVRYNTDLKLTGIRFSCLVDAGYG